MIFFDEAKAECVFLISWLKPNLNGYLE